MCGIAGLLSLDGSPPDPAVLDGLEAALGHRGPDGSGRFHAPGFAMVQTRLAIIDLKTGDQPIVETVAPNRRVALIANAEIYNYIELRAAMPGERFATSSDCETPLKLYRRDGLDFTRGLRGMYAIAIFDEAAETGRSRLVLARDPFGIKPLYYAETAKGFAFASEPAALVAAGVVKASLNPQARDEMLALQFSCGSATPFAGIARVLPGETLVVERGRIVERRRKPALPAGGPESWTEVEALERLDAALIDSIRVHQRADVPYGMFLSGGVDSSAVLAVMRDMNADPVHAFSVGFPGTEAADERERARRVAAAAGAHFEAVEFGEDDFWRLLPAIADAMDDPAADYATLPSFKLAELARARGLKVILTGEGGDELFAGYGRYRRALRPRLFGGRPMRARGAFEGLDVLRESSSGWGAAIKAATDAEATAGRTPLQVSQAVDCVDWLPNDLLTKLDRCLMRFGVEGRTPFLDPVMAHIAFRLPDRLKVRSGLGKWVMRRWLENRIPEAEPFAAKRGFTVPVGEWIAARGRELGPVVARQPAIEEICRHGAVEALFADPSDRRGQAAWTLLFYALWHRRHILGRPTGGDVFDALAA